MRKSNTQSLGEVLKESLKDLNIESKIKEVGLIKSWEEIVGKTIVKYTQSVYISKKILHVKLKSSVVRNELFMLKDGLIEKLNEKAGEIIITDIVFK